MTIESRNMENKMLRKHSMLGMTGLGVALLVVCVVGSASADVDVDVTYDKDKTVVVTETITITKTVTIDVAVFVDADFGAEAEALINQTNSGNTVCQACTDRSDELIGSTNNNSGVIVVNQAAGDLNNQASAIAISVDLSPPNPPTTSEKEGLAFANSQAATEQGNGAYWVVNGETRFLAVEGSTIDSADSPAKVSEIVDAINDNTGVVHVNEATGTHANQANSLALAVGFGTGGVAISEADLGQLNTAMNAFESAAADGDDVGVHKSALISTSVSSNTGIVNMNQSVGNGSNQANIVAFSFIVGQETPVPTP